MTTDAELFMQTIGRIRFRHILTIIIGCSVFLGSLAAGVAGYKALGGPVPASESYVDDKVGAVVQSIADLERFAIDSRIIILNDQWWKIQAKIDEVDSDILESPTNPIYKANLRRLKRDQSHVQSQIDQLKRERGTQRRVR